MMSLILKMSKEAGGEPPEDTGRNSSGRTTPWGAARSKWDLLFLFQFPSQFSSVAHCVWIFVTPWTAAHQGFLSITNSWSLLKLMSIESVIPSNHLILCHHLLLPSIFSIIRVFSNESALHIRWPKYWSLSFISISPSNEYSRLISFRMDWLDLLAVQGTLKSLLQHHSSKASILWCSDSFMVQLSQTYMTTGKTIALTRQTFFNKVMSLLFNMLSRLVIAFLPRRKRLLISRLHSPSAVILEPNKTKSVTVSIVSPSICHEVMGPDTMILVFLIWVLNQLFHSLLSLSSRGSLILLFGAERKLANYMHITHSLNTSPYKYVMTNANSRLLSNKVYKLSVSHPHFIKGRCKFQRIVVFISWSQP